MRIIGITGTLGAGKGTIVDYLVKKHGFVHYSARTFIIEEVKKRGLPINRDTITEVANDIRRTHGPGYIIQALYEQAAAAGKDAVIESIRTPGEVEALRAKGHFSLLAVDADPKVRYERILGRASETDHVSYEKFLSDEAREMESDDPIKQNIRAVMKEADHVISNTETPEELCSHVENILKTL